MWRRALFGCISLLPLASCSPQWVANALTPSKGIQRVSGVAYGPLPRQRLDLYLPDGLPPDAPLLVFLYGGGWTSGERDDYAFAALPLAGLGVAVAVPDYRLWPEVRWPGFLEDGALAIEWLRRAEPRRPLVAMGHSAGAFNAAALALDPRWGARGMVDGLIGLAGPYDFHPDEASSPEIFAGLGRVAAVPADATLRGLGPMLLLHGAADTTVGPYHSRILAARAEQAGVRVRHVAYPGMGHTGIIAALASPVRALSLAGGDVLGEVNAFLNRL